MAVPKRKTSKSKKRMRRSHNALKKLSLSVCPNCFESFLPHRVCPNCGYYKGRKITQDTED